ncbi:hypothetical protein KIN20_032374 [Parelaphostrongylus tenuis]|uniref:Uncharacterized protein n=1 Tax=Parelaphostrongylus tenuis TaxID=148309 RepID=A0AAD5R6Y1_PARTN|nr:hypothetical protein KIN20_032374 [Parelaphostrongylus tenuis]
MVLKSIGFVGRGLFNCAPTALAASGGVHQQQRSNYSYVGMASESDGTFAGDFNYGLHTLLFTELFRVRPPALLPVFVRCKLSNLPAISIQGV